MFSILKAQIVIGLIILTILTWATQNVCRYNFVLDKKNVDTDRKFELIEFQMKSKNRT